MSDLKAAATAAWRAAFELTQALDRAYVAGQVDSIADYAASRAKADVALGCILSACSMAGVVLDLSDRERMEAEEAGVRA